MGLGVKAYARHRAALGLRGQSPKAVRKAIEEGRIEREPDGTIDPEKADRAWAFGTRGELQAGPPAPGPERGAIADRIGRGEWLTPAQAAFIAECQLAELEQLEGHGLAARGADAAKRYHPSVHLWVATYRRRLALQKRRRRPDPRLQTEWIPMDLGVMEFEYLLALDGTAEMLAEGAHEQFWDTPGEAGQ